MSWPDLPPTSPPRSARDFATPPPAVNVVSMTLLQRLGAARVTPTAARIGVLQVMEAHEARRLNSEEIFREMRRRGMRASLSTVYRIAHKLYAAGLLLRELDDTGKVHYRLQWAVAETQCVRVLCRRSGQSVMLDDVALHAGLVAAAARAGLNVAGQTLVLEVPSL